MRSFQNPQYLSIDWDAENRLLAAKQGPTTLASFTYDGKGRRSSKTAGGVAKAYVYDGPHVVEERPSTGGSVQYFFGIGTDDVLARQDSTGAFYYVKDHLRSVRQVTNASGDVVLVRDYDPWGNLLTGASGSGFSYTAREWDPESVLFYYRARYYDPALGRFISEDPYRPGDGFAHPYAYVDNNPTLKVDPQGLFSMVSLDAASIPQSKWNAIYSDTREKCCNLDKIITDPKLRDNIKKSCDRGTINVSNRCPPGVAGGPTDIFAGTILSWFGGGVRTIIVCANNWDEMMKDWEGPGNVSIHEWAHGCGWGHFGGKGVPGQNGRDVHSPY